MPTEYTRGIIRWAHPEGYFLNAQGQKVAHTYSPSNQDKKKFNGYPTDRATGGKSCHYLMALAFYGPKPKNCQCHHLNGDRLDYRPDNLLCWLTREQHVEADRRQRALRKRVPNLHAFTYERLRELQDPRTMPREEFERQLALIPVFVVDPDCDRREPYKHC